jgi:type II secretory pathway predicted ATPase ExeA
MAECGTDMQRFPSAAPFVSPRLLQELRCLLNYPLDSTAPVALILCGHTELRRNWRSARSRPFANG